MAGVLDSETGEVNCTRYEGTAGPIIKLPTDVVDCSFTAAFRNGGNSKATEIENRGKI